MFLTDQGPKEILHFSLRLDLYDLIVVRKSSNFREKSEGKIVTDSAKEASGRLITFVAARLNKSRQIPHDTILMIIFFTTAEFSALTSGLSRDLLECSFLGRHT